MFKETVRNYLLSSISMKEKNDSLRPRVFRMRVVYSVCIRNAFILKEIKRSEFCLYV